MLKNLFLFSLTVLLSACVSPAPAFVSPRRLAAFNQNDVSVTIALQQDASRNIFLVATFIPLSGDHLYSKDIPRNGIYGEGRPTLLELTPRSAMRAIGTLSASVNDEVSSMGMDSLLVYPDGPVTLKLPVTLPAGRGWYDDQVSVTYESCSQTTCKTPVIGKLLRVRVPRLGQLPQ